MKIRSKLMAATAMLLVSTIMMTTASFAWFTISTAPEIDKMTTTVVANDNLEIALASAGGAAPGETNAVNTTGIQTNWGNIVDLNTTTDTATTSAYINLNKVLRPAKLDSKVIKAPTYGKDGRPETLTALTVQQTIPFGNVTGEVNSTDVATGDTVSNLVYGYYIDFWLRSNKGGAVTFAAAKERSDDGQMGGGSVITTTDAELKSNVRIGIQTEGFGTNANITEFAPTNGAFSGTVCTLTANSAQRVRVFVYLDGTNFYNKDASLSGAANIAGELNLQFEMAGVTTSMDTTAADAVSAPANGGGG